MLMKKRISFKILEDPGVKQLLHCTRNTGCQENWPVAGWICPVLLPSAFRYSSGTCRSLSEALNKLTRGPTRH